VATPKPILILADLKAKIAAIATGVVNGTGAYKTTVKTVEVIPRTWTWTTVAEFDRPFVGIIPLTERQQNQAGNWKRCILPFAIIALVAEVDGDAKMAAMFNLEDDLVAAIEGGPNGENTRRGGDAVSSTVTGIDREFINDPIQGALKIDLDVVYNRQTWST